MQANQTAARTVSAHDGWGGTSAAFLTVGGGLLVAFVLAGPVLSGPSAVAEPATQSDRAFVEYKLYDAMNEAAWDGSASKAHDGCAAAEAVVTRSDPDDFLNAELEECFGYVADIHRNASVACSRWNRAVTLYSKALQQGRRDFEAMRQTRFLRQERLRNEC